VVGSSLKDKTIGSWSWSFLARSKICTASVFGEFGWRPASSDEPAKHCAMVRGLEMLADFFEI